MITLMPAWHKEVMKQIDKVASSDEEFFFLSDIVMQTYLANGGDASRLRQEEEK